MKARALLCTFGLLVQMARDAVHMSAAPRGYVAIGKLLVGMGATGEGRGMEKPGRGRSWQQKHMLNPIPHFLIHPAPFFPGTYASYVA